MDASYEQIFRKLYEFSPYSSLSLFILALFRLGPIVSLAPFLGAKMPPMTKMGLLIALAFLFLPHIALTSQTAVPYDGTFILLAIKEVFIGLMLGFLINVPFQFAQTAGSLIDFLRGASSLQVSDPFSQTQTSSIGNLYNYVLIALFYALGGALYFFHSLVISYNIIPADGWINPLFFRAGDPFWATIMALATKVLALSIQLAAPSLLAILMTEVFLGIANRLAPQVQIAFLGMSVKSLLGLALLCLGWLFILQQVEKQTILWLKEIDRLLFLIPPLKG
jgi:type III secretory pathway component EscT